MKIAVIGTGYVGLVSGVGFAELGHDVTCVDVDAPRIAALRRGEIPIHERGLPELLARNVRAGRLTFSLSTAEAVAGARAVFIAVGTPSAPDGTADLRAVLGAAADIGRAIDGFTVVVTKSTVPVGTWVQLHAAMSPLTTHDFDIVSNPEFLKEGAAIDDFMKPDRVVIGSVGSKAIEIMRELYEPFVRTGNPIITMDNTSAEMTKYAANALLATRISFMNEIANLCERTGADVDQVRRGIGYDRRIGHHFLFPGVGYGGSCFPKDVRAVITTAREHGMEFPLMAAVEDVNEAQKHRLVLKVVDEFGANLRGKHFAIWGLTFKPRTDDMREAPSITVVEGLLKRGGTVAVHDPEALHEAKKLFGDRVSYHRVNYEALAGADALLIVTEWNEFRRPDFARMRQLMRQPIILDGRNLYEPEVMREHGFAYLPIGRTPVRVPTA